MKHLFAVFILVLLSLCTTIPCCTGEGHKRSQTSGLITPVDSLKADTTLFSVRVNGTSNVVKINNQPVNTTPGKLRKKNSVTVNGEGNSVSVSQADTASRVKISQNGNNNQINISQTR